MTAADTVREAVREVMCGLPVTCQGLTMVPLVSDRVSDADYLVLDEALERGWVEITESSDAGQVPERLSIGAIWQFCSSMASNCSARNRTVC